MDDSISATTVIDAPAEVVFAVLADPARHAAIDGTGWVREPQDLRPLTEVGQTFGMAMYHPNHPDGSYRMVNQVRVFDPPRAVCWAPGYTADDDSLQFGGWTWRYDLEASGPSRTTVTLTYDWSAVPPEVREHITFPPFGPDHLDNSLQHLSDLVASRRN